MTGAFADGRSSRPRHLDSQLRYASDEGGELQAACQSDSQLRSFLCHCSQSTVAQANRNRAVLIGSEQRHTK
jgi:hypothetical protein